MHTGEIQPSRYRRDSPIVVNTSTQRSALMFRCRAGGSAGVGEGGGMRRNCRSRPVVPARSAFTGFRFLACGDYVGGSRVLKVLSSPAGTGRDPRHASYQRRSRDPVPVGPTIHPAVSPIFSEFPSPSCMVCTEIVGHRGPSLARSGAGALEGSRDARHSVGSDTVTVGITAVQRPQ